MRSHQTVTKEIHLAIHTIILNGGSVEKKKKISRRQIVFFFLRCLKGENDNEVVLAGEVVGRDKGCIGTILKDSVFSVFSVIKITIWL